MPITNVIDDSSSGETVLSVPAILPASKLAGWLVAMSETFFRTGVLTICKLVLQLRLEVTCLLRKRHLEHLLYCNR